MLYRGKTSFDFKAHMKYGRTPLIWSNWDGQPSGYAENPDNWSFLLK
jgi:hypothetical protein